MRGAWIIAAAGCGRVAFDAVTVDGGNSDGAAPDSLLVGHDEDADGWPDALDVCPHIPDLDQADGDADLVGDACDPEPAMARQFWIQFAPLTGEDPSLQRLGDRWTVEADRWSFVEDGSFIQLSRDGALTDVDVWAGVDVEQLGPTGRQLAVVVRDPVVDPYYYGELFDSGTTARVNVMEYDGTDFNELAANSTPGDLLPLGRVDLHLRARARGTREVTMEFRPEAGVPTVTTAATAGYTGGAFVQINTVRVTGAIRYLAIIGSTLP